MCLAVPDIRPDSGRQRRFHCNLPGFLRFRPNEYIHNTLYKACRSKLRAAEFDRRLLDLSVQIVEQEGEKDLYYEPNVSELLFYRYRSISSNDLPAACADDFRVICMARNDITGNVDIRVFSPDDLILVCDEIGTIPDNR